MGLSQIKVRLNPDTMPSGSDLAVVNAARKSFGVRSESLKEGDKRLIQFLARGLTAKDFDNFVAEITDNAHYVYKGGYEEELLKLLYQWRFTPEHSSPFGHCFISFEVMLPIFLARQLVKHKFLRWSEYSRRYITNDVAFYEHLYRVKSEDKKQGSGSIHEDTEHWQKQALIHNERQLELYDSMINAGVAPEQARGVLPADLMTAVTWSGSLDAWASMCRLRLGSDAQKEAQFVAQEVYKQLLKYYPISAKALVEGPDL